GAHTPSNHADQAFVGCDNVPFTIQGVPAFTIQLDPKDYSTIHHAISDTIDKVKFEDLNFDAAVLAILAAHVASSERRLAPRLSKRGHLQMLRGKVGRTSQVGRIIAVGFKN